MRFSCHWTLLKCVTSKIMCTVIDLLDIIHRPVFFIKNNVSETGFSLRPQAKAYRANLYLRIICGKDNRSNASFLCVCFHSYTEVIERSPMDQPPPLHIFLRLSYFPFSVLSCNIPIFQLSLTKYEFEEYHLLGYNAV
jgi:hypothetical protein